jgi:hypothetical protein
VIEEVVRGKPATKARLPSAALSEFPSLATFSQHVSPKTIILMMLQSNFKPFCSALKKKQMVIKPPTSFNVMKNKFSPAWQKN